MKTSSNKYEMPINTTIRSLMKASVTQPTLSKEDFGTLRLQKYTQNGSSSPRTTIPVISSSESATTTL